MTQKVLVAGATGGTGREIVAQLTGRAIPARALVRHLESARRILGDTAELIVGDIHQPDTVAEALSEISAVICTIGATNPKSPDTPRRVDYEGVLNLVRAARTACVDHFVLVSCSGVTQPDHRLNDIFDNLLMWKLKGEDALRDSGLPYTIIRPVELSDDPGGVQAVKFTQGDPVSINNSRISRADVATICVEALGVPIRNVTFEASGHPGTPPDDWTAQFAGLQRDSWLTLIK